jgi:DNA (cytosine-5)-methyltransferase 1
MGIRVLDLFCGAGGSSAGASLAGASVVRGIDAWDLATRTFKENFARATVETRELGPRSRPAKDTLDDGINFLLASPECTNHSPAKGAKPRCEDSRRTSNYVLNFAARLKPRWIVLENVIQLRNWIGFDPLLNELRDLGYHINMQTLDAMDFAVPQTRRRLFVLCDRKRAPPAIKARSRKPRPASQVIFFDGRWPSQPLYDGRRAAATLERAERGIAALGRGAPFLIVYYGSDGGGGWQRLDRPLRTLTTLDRFGLITWEGREPMLRMLQVDELKRAMGFPRSHRFAHGSRRDRIKLIGNGVAPPVMQAIVETLAA